MGYYCPNCKDFKNSEDTCEDCGTVLTTIDSRTCPNCGAENPIDQKECIKCTLAFNENVEMLKDRLWRRYKSYLMTLYFGLFLFLLGVVFGLLPHIIRLPIPYSIFVFSGIILLVISQIYFYRFFYGIWDYTISNSVNNNLLPSIKTAGRAVGFLFIPLFNLYWRFPAFAKLPNDLNALAERKGGTAKISKHFGVIFAISSLPLFLLPDIVNSVAFASTLPVISIPVVDILTPILTVISILSQHVDAGFPFIFSILYSIVFYFILAPMYIYHMFIGIKRIISI